MNDLRYNMYGGARYPAPAVVGNFGSGMDSAAAAVPRRPTPKPTRRWTAVKPAAAADFGKNIEVYRGTKSDQVKVGENGR